MIMDAWELIGAILLVVTVLFWHSVVTACLIGLPWGVAVQALQGAC